MKRIRQRKSVVITLAAFGMVVFILLTGISEASPEGVLKQAIHWSISADWLDPATATFAVGGFHLMYLFHDGLLKAMPGNLYSPSLAESWSMSPDAKLIEFKLRRGVKFHNGDMMTAEDVAFSFWRYKSAMAKFIHDKTEKVEAVNPYLVRFYFKEPFPEFLEYLVTGSTTIGWVVPKKYVEKVGDAGFKKNPVGCGPYKFVEFVPGVKLVGEAFEGYWRKAPNVKRMEFYTVPEPGTRLAMVKRGEVDIATLLTGVVYEDAKRDQKLRIASPLSAVRWIVYIASQWDPKSPWYDPRVRKAASLAIDRQTLADIFMPGCGGVGSIGLDGDPLAIHFPADSYDPERAKKLLAEAGYPKGFHGGKFYPYQGGYWPYGEQIATNWKAVGINVDIILLDKPALLATREGGMMKGSLFVDNPTAPTIGGRLSLLFSGRSYGNYPDIQALWNQHQKEITVKGRKESIAEIQRLIYERTMWIPLTSTNSPAALGPRVKGDPHKVPPPIWFAAPFEDIDLVK